VYTDVSDRAGLIDQGFEAPCPKRKTMSLYKPLPPVPTFEKKEVNVPSLAEVALDNFLSSPIGQRVKGVPFDYMFADADEAEVTTIHDSDHDSLRKASRASSSQLIITNFISIPAEMVEDEDDAIPDDVGPSTPPQMVYHHSAHGLGPYQLLDLSHVDTSAVRTHEFITAGIEITTTGKTQLR
jgi:hypothetical protein